MPLPLEQFPSPSSLDPSEDWEDIGSASDYSHLSFLPANASEFSLVAEDGIPDYSIGSNIQAPRPHMIPQILQSRSSGGLSSKFDLRSRYFGFQDGNVCVIVGAHTFLLHMYKLQEFLVLANLVQTECGRDDNEATTAGVLQIRLEEDPADFANLLKVLYTSVYDKMIEGYPTCVLRSTLRLATKFQHSSLRAFAIDILQRRNLAPIERIAISRESNVPSWVDGALDELCTREQSVTIEEAQILGIEAFVRVASRREAHKLKVGGGQVALEESLYDKHICAHCDCGISSSDGHSDQHLAGGSTVSKFRPSTSTLAGIITEAFSAVDGV